MTRRFATLPALLLLLCGCPDPPVPPDVDLDGDEWPDITDPCVDVDGDGYGRPENDTSGCVITSPDCDDGDDTSYPGADELCDGEDNDCDGTTPADEADGDGDGHRVCEDDCDDADETSYPGADELCDGVDNDCDGIVPADEVDGDSDDHRVCDDDCDDADETSYPGADELCDGVDNDCDGSVPADEADGDSDTYRICDGDCEDGDDSFHPGADELCDGQDTDCDGVVPADELDTDADGLSVCEGDCDDGDAALNQADADSDGVTTCAGDCADADATVHPGATETCDGLDTDCDGTVPDDEIDGDGDGASECEGDCDDAEPLLNVLDVDGDGVTSCDLDCDDTNADTYPGATELCDGEDNNCDLLVLPEEFDVDGDGYEGCNGDCDDADPTVYTGAFEECDGLDNDCDGTLPAPELDADGDGYTLCGWPTGEPDCHDGDATIHPDAEELCNGVDDDCDPATLENVDGDGDGVTGCDGDCDDTDAAVYPGAPDVCDDVEDNDCDGVTDPQEDDTDADGYSMCAGDCDDAEAVAFPGAVEDCDGVLDNDCDGTDDPDEIDDDGDGVTECDGDCDDAEWNTFPGATEVDCDGIDQDCDGLDGVPTQAVTSLSDAGGSFEGENPSDYSGAAAAAAGDVNGDGYGDVIVGSYYNDDAHENAGKAYVVYGPAQWHESLGSADAMFYGEGENNYAGTAVAGAGDVNHDGYDDVLIGADGYAGAGTNTGRAYLVLGAPGATMAAEAWFTGVAAGDYAGGSLDGAGDVNGDHYDDVIIGADGRDIYGSNSGAAYLMFGPLSGAYTLGTVGVTFEGETSGDRAGASVSSVGDLDGDGYADLIIGAYGASGAAGDSGVAYVIEGDPGLSGTVNLGNATATLEGEFAGTNTGYAVAGAGDVDGDTYDDLLVGAYSYEGTKGRTYLVRGPVYGTVNLASADAKFTGISAGDESGRALSGAGDVNGDGYADVLIGAKEADAAGTASGEAYVFFGPLTGSYSLSSANIRLTGEMAGDEAGIAAGGGFDSDGDGFDDLVVGAHGWDNVGNWRGKAYVVMGPALCN